MLKVHTLTADAADLDEILPKVLSLSNAIFNAEPDSKYASETFWRDRLSHSSSSIVYVSAPDTAEPVGFLFIHPRTHSPPLRTGETEAPHIWLAGVLPEWRKAGCLAKMIDAMSPRYTGRVTICTIPSRFTDMWAWLRKRGWEVERDALEGRILLSKVLSQ